MSEELVNFFNCYNIKGFLDHKEGLALYRYAQKAKNLGPCLEIGSYCGKSSVYLGQACKQSANTLFAVDHHRGSEEHQLGEEYHDNALYDSKVQKMNSFPAFQRTINLAKLEDFVVPIVTSSQTLVKNWDMSLGLVFVDGGHSEVQAMHDCVEWSKQVADGGFLAIHDVFEKPEDGGQAPWLAMREVLENPQWKLLEQIESLVFLQKNESAK